MRFPCLLLSVLLVASPTFADDGAASIAAGGLVLMKREPRIVMAKEVLSIGERTVDVSYEFRNDSDDDITTEVAFPIPPYSLCCTELDPVGQGFNDFTLWIDGQPMRFQTEVRAFVGSTEVTALLQRVEIDAATFGHYQTSTERSADIERLPLATREALIAKKIIEPPNRFQSPLWRIEKKYHWTQRFPAHSIVHIRHSYTPWLGSSNLADGSEMRTVCPDPKLALSLRRARYSIDFVDFILTSANTWKQPIEDFTLNVRKPAGALVSFCWAGPISKVPDGFSAQTNNLVPKKELRIGFLRPWPKE